MKLHSKAENKESAPTPGQSLSPPAFQLKASDQKSARSPEPDPMGGGFKDYTQWQDGNMFVAIKHPDGNFTEYCISKFRTNPDTHQWEYDFTDEFKEAFNKHSDLRHFRRCFKEVMDSKFMREKIPVPEDYAYMKGFQYWLRDASGSKTVIGIFPDDEVKIETARTFYHVNDDNLGEAMDSRTGTINVDKKDENWKKRMPDFDPSILENEPDEAEKKKKIAEGEDGAFDERNQALSDLSLFNGYQGSTGGTNLAVTRRSTWENDGKDTDQDGMKLLIHEVLDHLSLPEYERNENGLTAEDGIYTTDYHHTKGTKSKVPLSTTKSEE